MFTRSPHKSEANYFGEAVNHLLNKAKQRIIKDAGIHDENAATVQSKKSTVLATLAKTVLLFRIFLFPCYILSAFILPILQFQKSSRPKDQTNNISPRKPF